jgi:hypothetical protein
MQLWEYCTVIKLVTRKASGILATEDVWRWADGTSMSTDARLNQLGEQGWELVACVPFARERGESQAGMSSGILFVL